MILLLNDEDWRKLDFSCTIAYKENNKFAIVTCW